MIRRFLVRLVLPFTSGSVRNDLLYFVRYGRGRYFGGAVFYR